MQGDAGMTGGGASTLRLSKITKSFGGITVLQDVDFDVHAGEVHALMGENGAGKSTLIKVMAGLHRPDSGEMAIDGRALSFSSPREAHDAGIATVHQELLLFNDLTVAENIFLGQTPKTTSGLIDWPSMRRRARELLDRLDCPELEIDARVGTLSVANRQRVEIARALSQKARFLIMDEPTAALVEADVQRLFDIVRRLAKEGVGIVYVSHRMPEIFALANRVTVLRDGVSVGTKAIGEVDETQLVSMMVGRSVDKLYPPAQGPVRDVALTLRGVSHRTVVQDISLELRRGEIVGLAGLVGSGRTETALTIFGITPATSGSILLDGREVRIDSPETARDLGIAYVPEDRGTQGLVKPQTIADNIALANLGRMSRGPFVSVAAVTEAARQAITALGIRARGPAQPVRQLSGGNQQKVVLAKWLETKPRILILDEPTRGIDVGAKAEIHKLIRQLAGEGMAILMISSELPEVLGMSDRVLVMSQGRIVGAFDKAAATPEAVGAAMTASRGPREAA